MKYLLGIDVGTTGTKTLLLRQDGVVCGQRASSSAGSGADSYVSIAACAV